MKLDILAVKLRIADLKDERDLLEKYRDDQQRLWEQRKGDPAK